MAVAAAQLGLSEATVARRLKGFETALGLQLFTREANRLVPTTIGLELAAEAGLDVGEDHLGAGGGAGFRVIAAEAARGPGHHDHLVGKRRHRARRYLRLSFATGWSGG